ncbi:MAG: transketolase C-terminal domain-containing protein, partial [Chlamydiota bacterium]
SSDPVIYLEHRWLHNTHGAVPEEMYEVPIGKAKVIKEGSFVTLVASSYMTLEARKALLLVPDIDVELIDLRTIKPLDEETLIHSVKKTGRLIVVDGDWKLSGIAAEIICLVTEHCFTDLKEAPLRITLPDTHTPTSWALANHYYPDSYDIAIALLTLIGDTARAQDLHTQMMNKRLTVPLDVPDSSFTGPF